MQTDYQIEDIISQSYDFVMYLALDREQNQLALVRLRYPEKILTRLTEEVFAEAFAQLKNLNHPCLRKVLDGGLDPIDRSPWIAAQWQKGTTLVERVETSNLTQVELNRLQENGQSLVNSLGPIAGAVSFSPHSIVISETEAGLMDRFSIDYYFWFSSFARGIHPSSESDLSGKFNTFLTYLNRRSELQSAPLLIGNTQGTPISKVAPPAPNQASSFPLKTTLFLTALMIAIGGGLWFVMQKKAAAVDSPVTLESSPQSTPATAQPAPIRSAPVRPKPKPVGQSSRPPRPRLDVSYSKVDSTNETSLKNHAGKWVRVTGTITAHDSNDFLLFADSSLRVSLPADSATLAENSINKIVTIKGFLKSATLLDVDDRKDIDITYLPKEIYTAKDEDQLREMAGETVTIKAKALRHDTSGTGKTLYLLFNTGKPEFAIGVQKSKAEESLNETFLKSLVGKTLRVQGPLKVESRGNRLSVVVTKKSQIELE